MYTYDIVSSLLYELEIQVLLLTHLLELVYVRMHTQMYLCLCHHYCTDELEIEVPCHTT